MGNSVRICYTLAKINQDVIQMISNNVYQYNKLTGGGI